MTFDAWLLAVPLLAAAAVFPGPNNLMCLGNGLAAGWRAAMLAVAGRILGFAILIGAAVAGLGAALAASATAFEVIRWAGVAYLAWIAWCCWRDADRPLSFGGGGAGGVAAMARRELLLVLTNPKAILIVTAILPQFVDPAAPATPQLIAIGATFLVVEWAMSLVYALGGGRIARLGLSAQATRRLNRGFAALFLGSAAALALSRR